jgi:hypothetical protein
MTVGLCDYLNTHLPNAESRDADTKAHGLSVQHKGRDLRITSCIDNFMAYNVSGFKHRPSYEEILQQQDNSNEQFEIITMMIQSATNESSNTTEEGSSSSAVESQPKHGRSSLVQQVARRVETYLRRSDVSDAMMPRLIDTIPPSLWCRAIRATVAHITSSHADNHVLEFLQEDIPPATTDLNDHTRLTSCLVSLTFPTSRSTNPEKATSSSGSTAPCTA